MVNFLRKKLGVKEHEALFCYINSVFAPGLDEGVGNLFRVSSVLFCFVFLVWEGEERRDGNADYDIIVFQD